MKINSKEWIAKFEELRGNLDTAIKALQEHTKSFRGGVSIIPLSEVPEQVVMIGSKADILKVLQHPREYPPLASKKPEVEA